MLNLQNNYYRLNDLTLRSYKYEVKLSMKQETAAVLGLTVEPVESGRLTAELMMCFPSERPRGRLAQTALQPA